MLSENITNLHVSIADRLAEFYELKDEENNETDNKKKEIRDSQIYEENIINTNSK